MKVVQAVNLSQHFREHKFMYLFGLLVRLLFAPITGHWYDLPIWMNSGELLASGVSPYSPYDHLGQTILWALWAAFSYIIADQIPFLDPYIYIFLLKLPPIIADMLIPVTILHLLARLDKQVSPSTIRTIVALIVFNPVFILTSGFWAMADSIALLLILFSFIFLHQEAFIRSGLMLTLAIALKLYPVILLPAYLLYLCWFKNNRKVEFLYPTGVIAGFFFIAYVPFLFFSWDSVELSNTLYAQTQREFGIITIFSIFQIGSESEIIGSYFYDVNNYLQSITFLRYFWAINSVLFTLVLLAYSWKKWRERQARNAEVTGSNTNQLYLLLYMTCSFYIVWIIFATWVSEQNFIPLLGLLIFLLPNISVSKPEDYPVPRINVGTIWALSLLLATHICINVPFNTFFYPVNDNVWAIFDNRQFLEVRVYIRIALAISTNTILIIILIRFVRKRKLIHYVLST